MTGMRNIYRMLVGRQEKQKSLEANFTEIAWEVVAGFS
jgi:hypothetical protein